MLDIVPLVPPTEFNLSKIQVGQIIRIPLLSFVDISRGRELTLQVRMMAASFAGTGANPSLSFGMCTSVPSTDGKIYTNTAAPFCLADFGAGVVPVAPTLVYGSNIVGSSTTPGGGTANLYLIYTQYATTCTSALFTVAVDLISKP